MDLWLRASLLARMAVASCVLLILALVIDLFVGVLDGGLGFVLAEPFQLVVTRLASLPHVPAVTQFPPVAVAAAGLAVGVGAVREWSAVRARPRFERLLPRTTPGCRGRSGGSRLSPHSGRRDVRRGGRAAVGIDRPHTPRGRLRRPRRPDDGPGGSESNLNPPNPHRRGR